MVQINKKLILFAVALLCDLTESGLPPVSSPPIGAANLGGHRGGGLPRPFQLPPLIACPATCPPGQGLYGARCGTGCTCRRRRHGPNPRLFCVITLQGRLPPGFI
ncbi:hypothetical protein V5799_004663 [Amblyomma americanum]|uniref:Secreted protein n=1 Tax=Amblyomma americanum TaxID=6943 RepID=A0AAQ4D5G4_AMBAM